MPNHVTTRCTVTGPAEAILAFRAASIVPLDDGSGAFLDFNTVVPMPPILLEAEESTVADLGSKLILWLAGNEFSPPPTLSPYESKAIAEAGAKVATAPRFDKCARAYLAAHPDVEKAGKARLQAIVETGHGSWYGWSIAHWGTKWNSYRFEDVDTSLDGETSSTAFTFQTAWSFPTPVFEALHEKYPALTFNVRSFDEGWGFACIGGWGPDSEPFQGVTATKELYAEVYGCPYEDDEEETEEEDAPAA